MQRPERKFGAQAPLSQEPFRWVSGIECSFIPHLGIDQYRWTQHDEFWRADFQMAAEIGCSWIRYTIPWHDVEKEPGSFDWTWSDERFDEAARLKIRLMLDLVHFGVPTWLPQAFADVDFPRAFEQFAREFGRRYRGHPAIAAICPINEPLTTAYFSGDAGLWPPHGHGLFEYMNVTAKLAEAFSRATGALREEMPGIEIVLCDSLEVAMTREPESGPKTSPHLTETLGADVARRMQRRHLIVDLILGWVDSKHPLRRWLLDHGFSGFELDWLNAHPQRVDVIGLDYYHHTESEIYTSPDGFYRQRVAPNPIGLYRAAQDYWERYHLPFMITETSAAGADENKLTWLDRSLADVRRLRNEGYPCIGFTWWPLFDHVDWDGAMMHQTGHIHPVGIFSLRRDQDGVLRRIPNGLTTRYRQLIQQGDSTVGIIPEDRDRLNTQRERSDVRGSTAPGLARNAKSWPIVYLGSAPWNGPWQRSHHLVSELLRSHPVTYVDPVSFGRSDANVVAPSGSLQVVSMVLPRSLQHEPDKAKEVYRQRVLSALRQRESWREAVLWWDNAWAQNALRGELDLTANVFDLVNHGLDVSQEQQTLERESAENADLVFYRSQGYAELIGVKTGQFVADGVDLRNFRRAERTSTEVPHDARFIRHPAMAYFGTIDPRIDVELLAKIADATLDWNVVVVGPVRHLEPESLPRRENLFWLGPREYRTLGAYAHGVDLLIAPFRINPFTHLHVPKKMREYIVTGRPILSTPGREIVAHFRDAITVADTHPKFIRRCHELVSEKTGGDRIELIREFGRQTWRTVSREMEAQVEQIRNGRPALVK